MGLSQIQGCCHYCKHHIETQQHYFYDCKIIFPVIQYIQTLFFEEDNVKFYQQSMSLGYTFSIYYVMNGFPLKLGNLIFKICFFFSNFPKFFHSLCRYHIHFPHFIFAVYGLRIFCIHFGFKSFGLIKLLQFDNRDISTSFIF